MNILSPIINHSFKRLFIWKLKKCFLFPVRRLLTEIGKKYKEIMTLASGVIFRQLSRLQVMCHVEYIESRTGNTMFRYDFLILDTFRKHMPLHSKTDALQCVHTEKEMYWNKKKKILMNKCLKANYIYMLVQLT